MPLVRPTISAWNTPTASGFPIPDRSPISTCLEAAQVFNRAAKALDKYGIKFFYHPHGYAFVPTADGKLFDLLMDRETAFIVSGLIERLFVSSAIPVFHLSSSGAQRVVRHQRVHPKEHHELRHYGQCRAKRDRPARHEGPQSGRWHRHCNRSLCRDGRSPCALRSAANQNVKPGAPTNTDQPSGV